MRAAGWADLYSWQVDRMSGEPLFRQIYLQIRLAILSKMLKPETRLPSTRDLAARLRVSRSAVIAAYEQLLAEGFLSGRIGSGTYISSELPEPMDKGPANGAMRARRSVALATPAAERWRVLEEIADVSLNRTAKPFIMGRCLVDRRTMDLWRKLSARAFRSLDSINLGYADPRGLPELRNAICDYLRAARAVQCDPEQIVVTAGAQQAMDIAIRLLLEPGDEVWVEDPGYPPTFQLLVAARAKVHPVPVDAQGINVRAGMESAPKARAVFVTPSDQHPLGVVLSMARRLELLEWAREARAWIIEDDYNSELRYAGPPLASMQGLDDGERVLYVGTLSKVLFPGLRVGYAVVPRALVRAFIGARYLMDRQPPSLYQAVLAEFMLQGHLAAHIRRTRLAYRNARDALVAELARQLGTQLTVAVPDQGLHLVAHLRDGLSDVALERAARQSGVIAWALSRSYIAAPTRSALLLGFSGYSTQQLVQAVAQLAQVMEKHP
jgi:GntR family transcriptional regulator / MocR family aminotransferase